MTWLIVVQNKLTDTRRDLDQTMNLQNLFSLPLCVLLVRRDYKRPLYVSSDSDQTSRMYRLLCFVLFVCFLFFLVFFFFFFFFFFCCCCSFVLFCFVVVVAFFFFFFFFCFFFAASDSFISPLLSCFLLFSIFGHAEPQDILRHPEEEKQRRIRFLAYPTEIFVNPTRG